MSSTGLRGWNQRMSMRLRIVLVTGAAVSVVVAIGGLLIMVAIRAELLEAADAVAVARAEDVAALATSGALPRELPLQDDVETGVQVIANGRVISGTENAGGIPLITPTRSPAGGAYVVSVARLPSLDSGPFRVTVVGTSTPDGPATVLVAVATEDVEDIVARALRWGGYGLAAMILPLCLILWVAVGWTLAPVNAIRQRAQAITGKYLHHRVPEPARLDEIGRLARTINAMLARLEESAHQQRRFLADAAHELRSPIASLRAQLESGTPGGRDWSDDLVPDLLADIVRMQRLVDQLLLLARSDAGMIGHQWVPVDLDDTIDSVVAPARLGQGPGGVHVDRDQVRPVQTIGDPWLLEQVVRNLLDNAVRHADHRVRVTLEEESEHALLTVEDDGPGIPAHHRGTVFRRFARLDASRVRTDGGVGLGLAIVADIVRAHGGTVTIGDSPAGGAQFRVRLPISRPLQPVSTDTPRQSGDETAAHPARA